MAASSEAGAAPEASSGQNGSAHPSGSTSSSNRSDKANSSQAHSNKSTEPKFYLAIFDDHLRSVPLVDGTLLVGRSKTSHLRLHDDLLSRKHCSLTTDSSNLILADLNSSNGTYVNGDRVGTRQLNFDDIVELGKTVMVVSDGTSWSRGTGMMNLRNPVKAQELVHRLSEGGVGIGRGASPSGKPTQNGVRPVKGLTEFERSFLKWLEVGETRLLPDMVASYLQHKLVSLLVRNSKQVRSAFTTVLEEMLRPELFQRVGTLEELHAAVSEMVARELSDLREDGDECEPDPSGRDLLEFDAVDESPDPTPLPDDELS